MIETEKNNQLNNRGSMFFQEQEIDFKKILDQLYRYKWIILASAVVGLLFGLHRTTKMIPQYRSTALIQIRDQASLGSGAMSSLVARTGGGGAASSVETEIALLKTRYLLEPVIRDFGLNISVFPRYFPFIGKWMAEKFQGNGVAKPFLGFRSYSWGGEEIKIKEMKVPSEYRGYSFRLVVGKNNNYQVYSSNGECLLNGIVGKRVTSSILPGLSLEVAKLKANSGAEFTLNFSSLISVANRLSRSLKMSSVVGNDPSATTGIFQVQFDSDNSTQAEEILNDILVYAIERNVQRKIEEAQKTLQFLNVKAPVMRGELELAENSLNRYHAKTGTLNMMQASQLLMQKLKAIQQMLEEIRIQKEELLQVYTPQHPKVISVVHQEQLLEERLNSLKTETSKFPFMNQEELNLMRQVKLKNASYNLLLNQKQNLEITKAGMAGDIVLLSKATPAGEISSSKSLVILAGFLFGAFISSFIIAIKSIMAKVVNSAEKLESEFGIPVRAVITFSKKQKQLEKMRLRLSAQADSPLILAKEAPEDPSIEGLRSLRVSLYIINPGHSSRIISITGAVSNIGKSFITLNLAYLIAETGKKVVLIDGDLRRGLLCKKLLQKNEPGLSEYLEGKVGLRQIVRQVHENFYFIPAGHYTTHPLELFQGERYASLIEELKHEFEQVVIDTPPILAVSDAVLIARSSDVKLFVVNAMHDRLSDVKSSIRKAQNNSIDFNGFILNNRESTVSHRKEHYYYRRREAEIN